MARLPGVLLVGLAAVGCLNPPADGTLTCGPEGPDCPGDYYCEEFSRTCWKIGHVPPMGDLAGAPLDAPVTPDDLPVWPPDAQPDLAVDDLFWPPDNAAPDLVRVPDLLDPLCAGKNPGDVCRSTGNPCQSPGICSQAGACGAITNKGDGTYCGGPVNVCRTDRHCSGGVCDQGGALPNSQPNGNQLCCGGNLVAVNSDGNCGVCGVSCGGRGCIAAFNHWYCNCSANSQCWSGCCSTYYGTPVCAASDCAGACIGCPGGTSCHEGFPDAPNWCSY